MNKVKFAVTHLMAYWNPIGVPSDIAIEEYISYVDDLLELSNTSDIRAYLCDLVINKICLTHYLTDENLTEIQRLAEVINLVVNSET